MRRLADVLTAMIAPGQDRAALLAVYLAEVPHARPLLLRPPPRLIPLATLRDWVAAEADLPDWLIDDCRHATGDLAEALALLLPSDPDDPPLAQVLGDLQTLPPGPLARAAILSMARRLSPEPRMLYFKLITGTFRSPVTPALLEPPKQPAPRRDILALMTHAEAALPSAALGPEITLALRDGNALIPIARTRAILPNGQTPALMAWIRQHATARHGPLRSLPATQVFTLTFTTLTPNLRRKSGLTLGDPQITAWHPALDPADAADLDDLRRMLP